MTIAATPNKRFHFKSFQAAIGFFFLGIFLPGLSRAQKNEPVQFIKDKSGEKIDVLMGGKPFTSFLFPDTLEKPVLYPLIAADGQIVTRGFPIHPLPEEPTDHPHHLGLWLNFENVNGLDFWNNSYAIPSEKKHLYGWIKTDRILETKNGPTGKLTYHANWTNQQNDILLEETTTYEFSGHDHQRIIDRVTVLKANTAVTFKDAKDGMLGIRLAHELQIPAVQDQSFKDDKGNVTIVKATKDKIATGNYLTSTGKTGDDAWSTRAAWCMAYGKMGNDSVSVIIMDHPGNPNYPAFWHARGYGLFAVNPLGEKIFTNGKSEKNLHLSKGDSVRFYYRIVIEDGKTVISTAAINKLATQFAAKDPAALAQ